MAAFAVRLIDDDSVLLRKAGIRFPLELRPEGFNPENLSTWPEAEGRLEWVQGRLLYMPPCADIQQDVAVDVVHILRAWSKTHSGFVVGGNEAGMVLGGDVRAADAAVWLRAEVGPSVGRLRRAAPVLAVEVAGQDEDELVLRAKANWYLQHGVHVVWLVLPEARQVLVVTASGEARCGRAETLPEEVRLPELAPQVARFFEQIEEQ